MPGKKMADGLGAEEAGEDCADSSFMEDDVFDGVLDAFLGLLFADDAVGACNSPDAARRTVDLLGQGASLTPGVFRSASPSAP